MTAHEELRQIEEQIALLQAQAEEARKKIAEGKKRECRTLCACIEKVKSLSSGHWIVIVEENGEVKIYPKSREASAVVRQKSQQTEPRPGTLAEKIVALGRENKSVKKIAEEVGTNTGHVYNVLRQYGIITPKSQS